MRPWLLAIIIFVLASGTAAAQSATRSVDWQRFDVDLAWQTDGSLIVTETQTINFHGTYQQGFRVIPLDRTDRHHRRFGIPGRQQRQSNAAELHHQHRP